MRELLRVASVAQYWLTYILGWLDEVTIFEGDAEAFAIDYIADSGLLEEIPENLQRYFDTEAFARDLVLGGDITEVDIMGRSFVVREG
ncbi:antirestriction protein ArdA [Paremcibacter congregatus]|uniref:antirestriction protein ArdA n=1 Tax=Paremcibacter congregatus TaxID=2043170 RepID=UPI0030EDE29F